MIIIIEGVDGQGKSFLSKSLAKHYKAELIHVSAPKTKNAFLEYIELLKDLNVKKKYIFDRCFYGERAYGPVYREKSTVSKDQQNCLELMIKEHNPVVIYCWTNLKNTKKVFDTRGEPFTKLEDVKMIHRLFIKAFKDSLLPCFVYSWQKESEDSLISKIEVHIKPSKTEKNE